MMTRMEWQEALRTLEKVAVRFEQAEWVYNGRRLVQGYGSDSPVTQAAGPARSFAKDALDDAHAIDSVREHLPLLLDAYRQAVQSIRHRDDELARLREKFNRLQEAHGSAIERAQRQRQEPKNERQATTREIVEAPEHREMLESLVTALEHNPVLRSRVRVALMHKR